VDFVSWHVQEAIRLAPQCGFALAAQGEYFEQLGDRVGAKESYVQALYCERARLSKLEREYVHARIHELESSEQES
jgi:hypothetical protein